MRRDIGRHAHGDAAGAIDEQVREARRQDDRLSLIAVVIGLEIDSVLVDVLEDLHGRARQDQAVHGGDGDRTGDPPTEGMQRAAGGRAVQEHPRPVPAVQRGDDVGLTVGHKADVAEEAFVENRLDGRPVVGRSLRPAPDGGARGGSELWH